MALREFENVETIAKGRRKRVATKARRATRKIMSEVTIEFFDTGS